MKSTESGVDRPDEATEAAQVLIVDDHPIVRHGLTQLINDEDGLSVCGSAATTGEALEMLKTNQPNLIIVDLSLGQDFVQEARLFPVGARAQGR